MGTKLTMEDNLITQLMPWVEQFVVKIPRLGENTQKDYRNSIIAFITYLEKNSREKKWSTLRIKQKMVKNWLKKIKVHYSLSTVEMRMRRVAHFLAFLERNSVLQENPLRKLQNKYPKKGLKGIILALMEPHSQKSLQQLKLPNRFASPLACIIHTHEQK